MIFSAQFPSRENFSRHLFALSETSPIFHHLSLTLGYLLVTFQWTAPLSAQSLTEAAAQHYGVRR